MNPFEQQRAGRAGDAVRRTRPGRRSDDGMATAEYAIGTVAAAGLGTVLYKLLTSDWVMDLIKALIGKALELLF